MLGRSVSIGIAALLAGCVTPRLEVSLTQESTELYVDGRLAAAPDRSPQVEYEQEAPRYRPQPKYAEARTYDVKLPYYGTTTLTGRHPRVRPDADEFAVDWLDRRQDLLLPAPFSPWLFPLDFALECLTYPFASETRYTHRAELTLARRTPVLDGKSPRNLQEIRERAAAARRER